MPEISNWLAYGSEIVKVVGSFASFYAVYKLRKIEQRYLFKATMPELVKNVQRSLDDLNRYMGQPARHNAEIVKTVRLLAVDAINIRRKARGDTLAAADELLRLIRPRRYFWQPRRLADLNKGRLIEIYSVGGGLLRTIEHEIADQTWSAK